MSHAVVTEVLENLGKSSKLVLLPPLCSCCCIVERQVAGEKLESFARHGSTENRVAALLLKEPVSDLLCHSEQSAKVHKTDQTIHFIRIYGSDV